MILNELLEHPTIKRALEIVTIAHANQKYGDKPYTVHLLRVTEILAEETSSLDFVNYPNPAVWVDGVFSAALMHDLIEDTEVKVNDLIGEWFYSPALDIVRALTKEKDLCRKCATTRNLKVIKDRLWARRIKLCDRIANIEECIRTKDSRLKMYLKEYPEFKKELYVSEEEEYWKRLDKLYESGNAQPAATKIK